MLFALLTAAHVLLHQMTRVTIVERQAIGYAIATPLGEEPIKAAKEALQQKGNATIAAKRATGQETAMPRVVELRKGARAED